jgi:hypothetical protein
LKGVGVYYTENQNIKLINFDIISNDLEQKAQNVVRGSRFLREPHWFKEIEKKHYIVCCDTEKSFRCSETIGFLFKKLSQQIFMASDSKLNY